MAAALPAPSPPAKIGWAGQPPVKVPASGLVITPGSGLVGRTLAGGLFLDNGKAAAAEVVSLFAPGNVAARTLGKWRNRRPSQSATLAVMEANLGTVGTAGTSGAHFNVVATDAAGASAVMPVSFPLGQAFYDLDQLAGTKVVDPWAAGGVSAGAWGNVFGLRFPIVPSQNFNAGGVSVTGWGVVDNAGNNQPVPTRCQLWQVSATDPTAYTLLATAYAFGAMSGNNTLAATSWQFDLVQQLKAGTSYFVTFDIFEQVTAATVRGMQFSAKSSLNLRAAQPADVMPAIGATDHRLGAAWITSAGSTPAAVNALSWDQLAAQVNTGVMPNAWGTFNDQSGIVAQTWTAGEWALTGTVSGLAPLVGDVTFSIAAVGAPGAGTAGADLNLRAVLLP